MSDKPESGEPESALIVWSQDDIDGLVAEARKLAEHPELIRPYTALHYMKKQLLLGAAGERLLRDSLTEPDPRTAALLATSGAKVSGEWREGILPVIKRMMKELGKAANEGIGGPPE